MKFTETEEYILSNLPTGSDINDDIKDFGIEAVDALANKLCNEAENLKLAIETQKLNEEDERKVLRQFIGHTLNLQRMKRTSLVKQLVGIRKCEPSHAGNIVPMAEPTPSAQEEVRDCETEDEAAFMKRMFDFTNAKNKNRKA